MNTAFVESLNRLLAGKEVVVGEMRPNGRIRLEACIFGWAELNTAGNRLRIIDDKGVYTSIVRCQVFPDDFSLVVTVDADFIKTRTFMCRGLLFTDWMKLETLL